MTTIRIDTLRNQLAGTIELLEMVTEELDDLHLLAYERATALSEAKVSGGSHDYALDTHGDPRARDAYRHLGEGVDRSCSQLRDHINEALNRLRDGATPINRGRRHLRLIELGEAISAQTRRIQRGDYTPVRRGPQPETGQAMDELRKERDQALRKAAAMSKERDEARRDLERLRERRGSSTR